MATDETLARQTGASVLWMTAQKWVTRVGGLVTIIVLTRLLSPEDFGLAAAASTLLPLVYVLSDVGFSTYIVQAEKVEQKTLSTAFWFSLMTGAVLVTAFFLAAPLIGALLQLPEIVPILRVLTISVAAIAVGSVPLALMRRKMGFRRLALMEVVSSLAAQTVAITAAVLGLGAWALVLQIMVSQIVSSIWVWFIARWRPSLQFSRSDFRAMSGFGIQVVGSGLTSVLREWLETAIVVAFLGVREMGYLNIAQRLVLTAQDMTASALFPVSTVAFSRVRDDKARLRAAYLRASAIIHAVVLPFMLFVAVSAPVLVPFLFGQDKLESALVTPALAAVVFLHLGFSVDQGLHLGVGRPRRWFVFVVTSFTFAVAVTAVSVQLGLLLMVLSWVASEAIQSVARSFVVGTLIGTPWWRVLQPIAAVAVPGAIGAAAGYGTMILMAGLPAVLVLAATGIVTVSCYLVATRLLRPRTFADVLAVLPRRLARPFEKVFRQPAGEQPLQT